MNRGVVCMLVTLLLGCGERGAPPVDTTARRAVTQGTAGPTKPGPEIHVDVPRVAGSLRERVARLRPLATEQAWARIPWRANLMEARKEAQAAGKPLFLWAMDGHPLGLV